MRSSLTAMILGVLAGPAVLGAQESGLHGLVLSGALKDAAGAELAGGDPLNSGQDIQAGGQPASLYVWAGAEEAPSAEALIHLAPSARLRLVGDAGGTRLIEVVSGSLVIRYAGRPALVVRVAPEGVPWVRLTQGRLWINVEAGRAQLALAEQGGQATRFAAAITDDPQTTQGGEAVNFEPDANQSAGILNARLESISAQAAAEDWLSRAERGDLLPNDPSVAQAQAMVAQAPQVAVVRTEAAAVTQAITSAVTQAPVTGTGAAGVQSTFSGVNALLSSGNPASVVVATRFERARIVGVSPASSGAFFGSQAGFLGFNTQVRRPFTLSR